MMEIDKQEIQKRFRRSISTYDDNARVQKIVIDHLCPIIMSSLYHIPGNVLEIGCGTGLLTTSLCKIFANNHLYINDLIEDLCYQTAKKNFVPRIDCLPGDVEKLSLPVMFDVMVSTSTFQWLTNPDATFWRLSKKINPDGVLIFTTFGKYNLREVRLVTGQGLDYPSQEELTGLLSPYFKVEKVVEEFHLLEFDNAYAVLKHLKKTGVNVSGDRTMWTKGRVNAFVEKYEAYFGMNGKVALTYHPLYFICRK